MISSFRQKVQANTDWGKSDPAPDVADGAQVRRNPARKARAAASAPITAHRLFPVFAALWFAALFGLGSLAISSEALGTLVTAIGLPALVPAAAPPLGFTAKLLVALLLTVVGGGLGLLLGLRLRPASARKVGPAARPVETVSDVQNTADTGVPKIRARDAHPDAPPRRPLVLTEAFADPMDSAADEAAGPLLRRKPAAMDDLASEPEDAVGPLPLELSSIDLVETEDDQEAVAELAPEPAAELAPEPAPVPVLLAATVQVPSGFTLPLPSREQILAGEPWSPVARAPLDGLGLVQLIERLALAIAARKAASDAGPPPPSVSDTFEAPEAAGLEADEPAPFAPPAQSAIDPAPVADQPQGDEPASSAREAILRRLGAMSVSVPAEAGQPEASVAPASAPFSRPRQADAVVTLHPHSDRLAPPFGPAVASAPVLPDAAGAPSAHSGAAAPFEADEALRTALATLQRMSARG